MLVIVELICNSFKRITNLFMFWEKRYAKDLVNILYSKDGPDFGAASDGMLHKA